MVSQSCRVTGKSIAAASAVFFCNPLVEGTSIELLCSSVGEEGVVSLSSKKMPLLSQVLRVTWLCWSSTRHPGAPSPRLDTRGRSVLFSGILNAPFWEQ